MAKLSDYLAVWSKWYGYNEANGTDDIIIDIYNNQRPAGSYKMSHSDPWCHATVSAAAYVSGCNKIIPNTCYCPDGINWFKSKGRWVGRYDSRYSPYVGGIIYYDWGGDGVSDHVGVIKGKSGSTLTVREGNKNDQLMDRYIDMYDSCIMGYGVPAYDDVSTSNPSTGTGTRNWMEYGDKGAKVKDLQTKLIACGYSCGSCGADGDYGNDTVNAVKRFQSAVGISVDGEAGEITMAKLNAKYKSLTTTTKPPTTPTNTTGWISRLQKEVKMTQNNVATPELLNKLPILTRKSKGNIVKLVQEKLKSLKYNIGSAGADGDYGNDTFNAVKQYQSIHKLHETGYVTYDVWAAMLDL